MQGSLKISISVFQEILFVRALVNISDYLAQQTNHKHTFLLRRTWKRNIITPCRELQMAKRYLNTIVSRLKTSNPNTHVSPSNGSSAAEPLKLIFIFLNIALALALVVPVRHSDAPDVRVVLTWLEDKALRKARMKITTLT